MLLIIVGIHNFPQEDWNNVKGRLPLEHRKKTDLYMTAATVGMAQLSSLLGIAPTSINSRYLPLSSLIRQELPVSSFGL